MDQSHAAPSEAAHSVSMSRETPPAPPGGFEPPTHGLGKAKRASFKRFHLAPDGHIVAGQMRFRVVRPEPFCTACPIQKRPVRGQKMGQKMGHFRDLRRVRRGSHGGRSRGDVTTSSYKGSRHAGRLPSLRRGSNPHVISRRRSGTRPRVGHARPVGTANHQGPPGPSGGQTIPCWRSRHQERQPGRRSHRGSAPQPWRRAPHRKGWPSPRFADTNDPAKHAVAAEAQSTALRYFALDGADHECHEAQARMILRYIAWRNRNAEEKALRELVKRATLPDAALATSS